MNIRVFPPTWPIARRLTVLYALFLFLLLAVAAAFLDWVISTDMRRDNGQFIAAEVQSIRTLMRQRPGDLQAWREEVEREAASLPGYARYYVRILDEQGRTIVETPGMSDTIHAQAFPEPLPAYDVNPMRSVEARGNDGRLFLLIAQWVDLHQPEVRKRVIQVAFDRSHDATIIADYRRKVLVVLLVGLFLSTSFGFFIARAGLRPLSNITRAVKRISADHLNERVNSTRWPPEITALAAAFDSMLERLAHSFALLSQFSADLAHELRTPINNLRGETEVALGKLRTVEEYQRVLESSLEEYERLTRVIENLLFLARADTSNTVLRPTPVNVRQEIDALMEYFGAVSEENRIEVAIIGNALLHVDPVLFRRALTNLLSNAFQYTPQSGKISLSIGKINGSVEVAVSDTGIGIERTDLDRVLGRFFRSEKARSLHPQGTGLGLAIVKSIMDLHSGSVAIESTPGEGTTVRLRFPSI
jgi:two-component system, OmpR family, heavy metal sensor histidine kinase CusS